MHVCGIIIKRTTKEHTYMCIPNRKLIIAVIKFCDLSNNFCRFMICLSLIKKSGTKPWYIAQEHTSYARLLLQK